MQFSHTNKVFAKQKSLNQSQEDFVQVDSIEQDLIDLGFQVEEIIVAPKIASQKVLMRTVIVKDLNNKLVRVSLNSETLKKVKMYLNKNTSNHNNNLGPLEIEPQKTICRICLESCDKKNLVRPCQCKGSIQYIHEECLKTWLLKNHNIDEISQNRVFCELCKKQFKSQVKFQKSYQFLQLLKISSNQKICLIGFLLFSLILYGMGILLSLLITKDKKFFVACIIGSVLSFFIGLVIQTLIVAMILEITSVTSVERWDFFSYSESKRMIKSFSAPVLTIKEDFMIKALTKQQTNLQPNNECIRF